jgi:hypothetical protein
MPANLEKKPKVIRGTKTFVVRRTPKHKALPVRLLTIDLLGLLGVDLHEGDRFRITVTKM